MSSQRQQIVLRTLPRCSAILSLFGSCHMMYDLIQNNNTNIASRKKYNTSSNGNGSRSPIQSRLLFGLCITDVISSIAWILGNIPVPKELGGLGNSITCNLQGVMYLCLPAAVMYNGSLALYYLLVIRYQWNKKGRALQKVEYMIHSFIWIFVIVISVLCIVLGIFTLYRDTFGCTIVYSTKPPTDEEEQSFITAAAATTNFINDAATTITTNTNNTIETTIANAIAIENTTTTTQEGSAVVAVATAALAAAATTTASAVPPPSPPLLTTTNTTTTTTTTTENAVAAETSPPSTTRKTGGQGINSIVCDMVMRNITTTTLADTNNNNNHNHNHKGQWIIEENCNDDDDDKKKKKKKQMRMTMKDNNNDDDDDHNN